MLWEQLFLLLLECIPTVSLTMLLAMCELSLCQQSSRMITTAFDGLVTPPIQQNLRSEDQNG